MEWEKLESEASNCQKCRLAQTRANVVFGTGIRSSKLMLIGEGPGANEDLTGQPFVGRAGELLDKMLAGAGFSRKENLYIANMVKCRPPQNRDPEKDEVEACIGYLHRQISIIEPKLILCLGRIAAQYMIDPSFKVTQQHGEIFQRDGMFFMGTFHPAALLRNPNNKEGAFADLLKARDFLKEAVMASTP